MSPNLLDPNNHVPEISPDDDWGDLEGVGPGRAEGAIPILPPRRIATDRVSHLPSPAPATSEVGLRIDSNLSREESTETPHRLEVQEIKSGVVRLGPGSSDPLKVQRHITFHQRPEPEPRDEESSDEHHQWGAGHRRPMHWILGAGVGVFAVVVLVMMLLPAINAPNTVREGPVAQPIVETKVEGLEEMNLLLSKQSTALKIFGTYVTASHVDEIIPLIREGDALREVLHTRWHPQETSTSWEPAANSVWEVLYLAGRPSGLLQGTLPDQSGFSAYFILDGNRLLLDWKATAGFGTATFTELEKGLGDPGEIRGDISTATYYNHVFPEADYHSYRLLSPNGQTAIWCYARHDEAPDLEISPLLHENDIGGDFYQSRKITLRLNRGPSGTQPNQWLIEKVLHLDWVTP